MKRESFPEYRKSIEEGHRWEERPSTIIIFLLWEILEILWGIRSNQEGDKDV